MDEEHQPPFWSLFLDWGWLGWLPIMVVQCACLVHVLKTGRPFWWMWIIFGFPLIGVAAYLFVEIRPSFGKLDWKSIAWRFKSQKERIQIRAANLDDSNTIRNRLLLVSELHADRQFDRECDVLTEGLCGAFKDDPQLLIQLAAAHLEMKRIVEAEHWLGKCVCNRTRDQEAEFQIVRARLLGYQSRGAEAEQLFQSLIPQRRTEAARFYFAEFLHDAGRSGEAQQLLNDICQQYRRGTRVWRYQEESWYLAARRLRKQIQTTATAKSPASRVGV